MPDPTVPRVWRPGPLGPEALRLVGTAHPGELADELTRMQPLEIDFPSLGSKPPALAGPL